MAENVTDPDPSDASCWALLIGINYYGGKNDLKGCVRDVQAVENYLRNSDKNVDITILTASNPLDSASKLPKEDPSFWPSFENLLTSMNTISDYAKPGSRVLFYYAGHGNQRPDTSDAARQQQNLALSIFEGSKGYYEQMNLHGSYLTDWFEELKEKNILLTVVLDCCFSGGVFRDDGSIRSIEYDTGAQSLIQAPMKLAARGKPFRDGQIHSQWLTDPNGYTIFAACTPYEKARETYDENGDKIGAFSYYLMKTMERLAPNSTGVDALCEELRMTIQAANIQQTPMVYGRRDLTVFREVQDEAQHSSIPVYSYRSIEGLRLDSGQAHGVKVGDRYMLHSLSGASNAASPDKVSIPAKVEAVRALTSDLVTDSELPLPQPSDTQPKIWRAEPLAGPSRKVLHVALEKELHLKIWDLISNEEDFGWLRISDEEGAVCDFRITVNDRNEYQFLSGQGHRVTTLPKIPYKETYAAQSLLEILKTISKYEYVKDFAESSEHSSFKSSFTISTSGEVKRGSTGDIELQEGTSVTFTIQNNGSDTLFMAMFNLTASWDIDNLFTKAKDHRFVPLQPRDKRTDTVGLSIPDKRLISSSGYCEDVFKFYFTNKPTQLSSVPQQGISLDYPHTVADGDAQGEISSSLSPVGSESLGDHRDVGATEAWATRSYVVRVYPSSSSARATD